MEPKQLVYDNLYPAFLTASGGFEIPLHAFKFRKVGTWQDLDQTDPLVNAIYDRFKVKDKKGNIVFKPPGKLGFQVALVLSPAQ